MRRLLNDKPAIQVDRKKSCHPVLKLVKKRLAIFRSEGRLPRWKSIDKAIKRTLSTRKDIYFYKETERLRTIGRGAGWYSILNKINDKPSDDWHITQLEPDKTPKQIATDLAAHFSKITNQADDLEVEIVPSKLKGKTSIPQLVESTVEKKMKEYKNLTA